MGLTQFMSEEKPVNRWLILKMFLGGMFAGAVLGIFIAYLGLV